MKIYFEIPLPVLKHHPQPNIIPAWRKYGVDENISFIEYPSIKVKFPIQKFDQVFDVLDETGAKCVFVDGEEDCFIIPAYYEELVEWFMNNLEGQVIDSDFGKESEYATLAIKAGLKGQIVSLGDSIFGYDGTAQDMVNKALQYPDRAIAEWSDIYEKSLLRWS